jgi:hypothetical protein
MAVPYHFLSTGQTGVPPNLLARGPAPVAGEALQVLTSIEDVRAAVKRVASGAQRLMSLFTEDLEPDVYDQAPFLDIIKRFVLSRNFAKVRVLTHRPLQLIGNSNRFVAMSRRLSSYIEIRTANPIYANRVSAMLIADSKAIMYRTRARQWEGVAGFNQPPIARLHLAEFDEMWIGSPPEF